MNIYTIKFLSIRRGAAKIRALAAALALAGVATGAIWYFGWPAKEQQVQFITAKAARGDLRAAIIATGTVQPVSMVNVGTQISGTLKSLYFDYNSRVKKGQLIAVIDPSTQEAQVRQSEASLTALRADALDAEASLQLARQNAQRNRELYESKLIARADLDASEASLASAKARLTAANARIVQQQADLEQAKLQLSYAYIYSPVDGVIVRKSVEVGQTVAASYNTPTIAEIAEDLARMQVEVNIDEADIGSVYEGQAAEFNVDAFPERRFEGSVEQIRLSPTVTNNVTSYAAIVAFENEQRAGQNLIPGMTANVTLIVNEKKDVVMAPNAALRFRPLDPASSGAVSGMGEFDAPPVTGPRKPTVYGLEKGEPVRIEVERGITDGVNTEIISGLEAGTEIITGIDAPGDR